MHWYVQVQNQAYGPYSEQQMQGFVSEGRVDENSLISNAPESGFFHAVAYDVFKLWAGTGQSLATGTTNGAATPVYQTPTYQQPASSQPASPQPASAQPNPQQTNPYALTPSQVTPQITPPEAVPAPNYAYQSPQTTDTAPAPQTNVFLVMAEIRSDGAMGFLQSLQQFGTAQRIGDTVWLLRSASGVEQLRNALSQTLDRQDRLFILDSSANKTAWFNIGADLDSRIRELWNEDED